jgi:putative ABC transport system permease protein
MTWVALRMLTAETGKFLRIVFGVTFTSLLIAQQSSVFWGLMLRTTSQIVDVHGPDVWVMNPDVRYIDDTRGLPDEAVSRVRGVPGVAWAVWFFKGSGQVRLADGTFQQVLLLGLDDATLVGAPRRFLAGSLADLRRPDAVALDEAGFRFLWPGEPPRAGKVLEMNDHRAVVTGVFEASQTYQTLPLVVTRLSQVPAYVPAERRMMPFVLACARPGCSPEAVASRIGEQTGLQALSREEFAWRTLVRHLRRTNFPINFAVTVLLGFLVGSAIAAQTFYLFTLGNLKQFAALKAMGLGDGRLAGIVLLQAAAAASIGYALGVGLAALFGQLAWVRPQMAFFMPWQVLAGTGAAVVLIAGLASVLSLRRVLVLGPAEVFRG